MRNCSAETPLAKLVFYCCFGLTVCSFVGAVLAGMAGSWRAVLLAPFAVFFILTLITLRAAARRGQVDPSEWRGDI
jgi:hypothetical protein